jgi:hypothetical protein
VSLGTGHSDSQPAADEKNHGHGWESDLPTTPWPISEREKMETSNTRSNVRACSTCASTCLAADLVVKRADFRRPGVGGRMLRTRVLGYLCPDCIERDNDYALPRLAPFSSRGAASIG